MLSTGQSSIIKKIIQRQKGTLQQAEDQCSNAFKQAISLFNAASYMCELLQNHKLQLEERIISLYLVLVSFHESNPENHPFVVQVLHVSTSTDSQLERLMIYEILIRRVKNRVIDLIIQYSGWLIQEIHTHQEKNKELLDEDKQIRSLRNRIYQKFRTLECNLPLNALNDEVPEFLRLVPQFIQVSSSELNWLSPGIISDVEWDNSAEIDKKLQKCRKIFETSLKRPLEQQERTELLNSIQTDPYSPLHIGFNVKDLNELIIHNSYIAASLVMKLSKYHVFQEFLEQFLVLPTSAPLLDVTARIIKQIRVPQLYVQIFCCHHMKKMIKTRQNGDNYKGLAYTMTAFLHCMFQNQIVNPYKIAGDLKNFMNQFSNIMDFGHIRVLLDQHSESR